MIFVPYFFFALRLCSTLNVLMEWQTSRRIISLETPLVMGILNATPDSFSDGGRFLSTDAAFERLAAMIDEGADLIDVGGESTRPGSERVSAHEEISRVVPVIRAIAERSDIPISIDTSKSEVAAAAVDAGAEIINDISGLRWDPRIARVAAETGAGLILMHSRGNFEEMHSQPVENILNDVTEGLRRSAVEAVAAGVDRECILLDIGIGFGKTPEQNLELIARLGEIRKALPEFGILVGASRKSTIGRVTGEEVPERRLAGSLAAAAIAVFNRANVIRAHDVAETAQAVRVADAIRRERGGQSSADILE